MLVQHFLERSARDFPNKIALVCQEERLSYRQIEERSNRLAHALLASGLQRGDRVAICLENSAETVVSVFAVLKAGGVFLLNNPSVKPEKFVYILNNCRAASLILSGKKTESLQSCWDQTSHLRSVFVQGDGTGVAGGAPQQFFSLEEAWTASRYRPIAPVASNIDADLAALIYTSGSTAKPKGVMLSHRNICSATASVTRYLENQQNDVILNVLPLFFGYGLYQVLMTFYCGATVILERSFAFPHATLEKLGRERVTGMAMVPTTAALLLQMDLTMYDFSSLRYLTNAGAALPVEFVRQLRKRLPHVKLFLMYGQTECIRTSYLDPAEIDNRPDSVGKAMPNCEVYVADEEGRPLPSGNVGELIVRGSNVMMGYWEMPEETARVLGPGPFPGERVLRSGDLFRTDEQGFLYFVSRADDIIKVRGHRIGPKEIEDVLCRMPQVVQAVVVGVPDAVSGTAIKAILQLVDGSHLTPQDVMAFCAERLEDFMVPKIVEFCKVFPTTDSGKILRNEWRTNS
jgi:amino acid adenylation domain-containing protein